MSLPSRLDQRLHQSLLHLAWKDPPKKTIWARSSLNRFNNCGLAFIVRCHQNVVLLALSVLSTHLSLVYADNTVYTVCES